MAISASFTTPGVPFVLRREEDLEDHLVNSGPNWVVVEFGAKLAACEAMHCCFDDLAKEHPVALFLRVDIDSLPGAAHKHGVSRVPTYAMFWCGQKEVEFAGCSERKLHETVLNCLELDPEVAWRVLGKTKAHAMEAARERAENYKSADLKKRMGAADRPASPITVSPAPPEAKALPPRKPEDDEATLRKFQALAGLWNSKAKAPPPPAESQPRPRSPERKLPPQQESMQQQHQQRPQQPQQPQQSQRPPQSPRAQQQPQLQQDQMQQQQQRQEQRQEHQQQHQQQPWRPSISAQQRQEQQLERFDRFQRQQSPPQQQMDQTLDLRPQSQAEAAKDEARDNNESPAARTSNAEAQRGAADEQVRRELERLAEEKAALQKALDLQREEHRRELEAAQRQRAEVQEQASADSARLAGILAQQEEQRKMYDDVRSIELHGNVVFDMQKGRIAIPPGKLTFKNRVFGIQRRDPPIGQFDDVKAAQPILADIVSLMKMFGGGRVEVVHCDRENAAGGRNDIPKQEWCKELAQSKADLILDHLQRMSGGDRSMKAVARLAERETTYVQLDWKDRWKQT